MIELQPAAWLDAARAQSNQLAEARAQGIVPLRVLEAPRAARRPRWLATAVAAALLLAMSGAYAWVAHLRAARLHVRALSSSELVTPHARSLAARRVVVPTVAPAPSAAPRPHPHRDAVAPSSTATGEFVEPDGEVIFVHPHVQQPPLFDAKEYKRRGVLVHE